MTFEGFPVAALDFYDDLEVDNTKSFWEAHKHIYRDAVKAPFDAVAAAVAEEFGPLKIFRPYRDVRFAKDKTPYKAHQGAFVGTGPATGWYVELSSHGLRTGAGFYEASGPRLAAFRDAVADERTGPALEAILEVLTGTGMTVGGDRLKTRPRGYDPDHPRLELLKHRSLTIGRSHGFEPVIHTPAALDLIREDWRACRPLLEWLADATAGVPDDVRIRR
ncbi:DUF2461 domain-containing protein [Nocardioides sp.]|uniref:DUF2461 domain-containing protein n=1 Tax=Nocardioides sp. TaxID=35761 RepID=UPI00351430E6